MDQLMTVDEVAQCFRVHPSTIYLLLKKRQVTAIKVGREWRFMSTGIYQWIVNQRTGSEALSCRREPAGVSVVARPSLRITARGARKSIPA